MRIRRLAITGFGPYKTRQTVDFEHFDDDGLFLISGKTGAGKSSILDAICFALYGNVPRYDGTEQKLRSDHAEPHDATLVELEFTVDGTGYRIARSPAYERPKKSGSGTTLQAATAELFVGRDDTWEGIAARPVDVAPEIARIVGLTKEQFLQVILLAQNRFQEFLLAKNDDRQKVLRNLFSTRRFLDFEVALVERRKVLDGRLGSAREALASETARAGSLLETDDIPSEPDVTWFDMALASLTEERDYAKARATRADADFTAADLAHRALEITRSLQVRRDQAAARTKALDGERDAVASERVVIDAARRAAIVWPYLTARQKADDALDRSRVAEATARAAYLDYDADPTEEALLVSVDAITRQLGTLDAALAEEESLAALTGEIGALQNRVDECSTAVDELTEHNDALPAQLESIAALLSELQVRASAEKDAADRVERTTAARAAAVTAAGVEPQRIEALLAETRVSAEHATAAAAIHDLMVKRLGGYAAELAAELRDGKSCAVCGSTNHPAPAESGGARVTEDDVERAQATAEKRRAALDAAHARSKDLEKRLTEARARAGDKTVEALDAELTDARNRLQNARTAAAEVTTLGADQARLKTELAEAAARLTTLCTDRDASAQALLEQQTRRASLDERIAQHRGEHDTIMNRIAQLQRHRAAADDVLEAIASVSTCKSLVETAAATLHAQLLEHGFADDAAVVTAKLGSADIGAAEKRIRAFDDALAAATATLAEPEIAALPGEPVDLAPAELMLADARAARDAAMSSSNSLGTRVEQLGKVVSSARGRLAASAKLLDEHRQLRELANAVEGKEPNEKRMRLETYVLAARLEEIVDAANARLGTMTAGRYALEHDDALQYRGAQSGLGLVVRDEHSGRARATHSLSGGEMFLASLALALGLAEVVTNQAGGIRLDTLFIDEGFGSLDSDTLDIAMSTLDGLRTGGRTIGLISHIDAMKEQIPAKLHITVNGNGWSEIAESYEVA